MSGTALAAGLAVVTLFWKYPYKWGSWRRVFPT
jgi:hypothetical protein